MIIGKIHQGSGIGDQLFSYIITRVIALDKGYDFGFVGKEFFKGKDFMQLDWGTQTDLGYDVDPKTGGIVLHEPHNLKEFKFDKPYYDPEVNFIEDGTIIDGYGAQDSKYFRHRHNEIKEWLKVDDSNRYDSDDVCVMNIRGGEYRGVPELFLPKSYWEKAMEIMVKKYPNIEFVIHTDDIDLAKEWFPDLPVFKDITINWLSIRFAKHLIISNSAFAIIPALLNEDVKEVIAPFGWNARNASLTEWRGRPMNYYKKFTYI